MTSEIWKFPLSAPTADSVAIMMPVGAEVLCVQVQHGRPCIWARVNPDAVFFARRFCVFGTGHSIPPDDGRLRYVGTFQLEDGQLVFHLFEVTDAACGKGD